MNSVHEPSSRTMSKYFDSGKYRVEPGQKQAECTKCTALASPGAQAARPAPCRAAATRLRPAAARPPRTPTQSPPAARAKLALRAPARSPCAPQHARLRPSAPARACCLAQRLVVTQLPVLRHRQPCLLPLFLTIEFLYCDQIWPPAVKSHAIQILQYNSLRLQYNPASLAASYGNTTSTLQYKIFLSHNTIWAVAHSNFFFCTIFFSL